MTVNYRYTIGLVLICLFIACSSNKEVSISQISEFSVGATDILSWKVPHESFVEEMLAIQNAYEEGNFENFELTIKKDTVQKKYLFTAYPQGVKAYKDAINK